MTVRTLGRIGMMAAAFLGTLALAADRPVPYWASIAAGDALMRTGPGRTYPATWRYRREGLPVRVVQVHESWRKVRDSEGTTGWMASVLLSAERTAMVVRDALPMREAPESSARLLWRAAPGVIGKIRHCSEGWCEFTVDGRTGYVDTHGLWGVAPDEAVD